jgi:eukaryotic-like serine/threonine-protein kinase
MVIATGTVIGPYEIVGWLGAGGMGEVYRARDPRLDREVALKLIAAAFATDAGRVHRFAQEARAAGQINHPNILSVYDTGTHGGAPFIVSELLEGASLRDRLQEGALPPRKAIDYARQSAEGLAAAHAQGIVHRDVKPDNLFITNDGRVKILDFGIAKLTLPSGDGGAPARLATDTADGTVIGTAAYMSPEQARGEVVDARSDIFSVGAVLYEMLSGHPPFARDTAAETSAAILIEEPAELPAAVPPSLIRIVSRCLEKTRGARFQSAPDLAFALEVLAGTGATVPHAAETPRRSRRGGAGVAWAVAALAVVASAAAWWPRPAAAPPPAPARVLSLPPSAGVSLATEEAPVISPDGGRVAFVGYDAAGRRLLYTRGLAGFVAAQPLDRTEGASLPFWSPRGDALGFFAQGSLKTVEVATGSVRTLAPSPAPRGGTWSADDVIVFAPRPQAGPHRIAAGGGTPATQVAIDAAAGWLPSFLPDGRHFLIFVRAALPENAGVFVASLDSPTRKKVLSSRSNAVYAAPGYLLYWGDGALLAQRFDTDTLEVRGNAIEVASGVGLNAATNQALFSLSVSGTLVFLTAAAGLSELQWVDRAGAPLGGPLLKEAFTTVALSPDATKVAYDLVDPRTASMDLWALNFTTGQTFKLTFGAGQEVFPLWSPDGRRIAFSSIQNPPPQLYELQADGTGIDKPLIPTDFPAVPSGWSRGGLLVYTLVSSTTGGDIWVLPLDSRKPYPVVQTAKDERYGTLSPDGRRLAYVSNDRGTYEVYVQPFPGGAGMQRLVSTSGGGGLAPQWSDEGRELFYLGLDKRLMVVDMTTRPPGAAKALFATRTKWMEIQPTARTFAVAPGGKRFLLANATAESEHELVTVILNWTGILRK